MKWRRKREKWRRGRRGMIADGVREKRNLRSIRRMCRLMSTAK